MRMRVLLLDDKQGDGGGAGRYLADLAALLVDAGHEVEVAFIAPSENPALRDRLRASGAAVSEIGTASGDADQAARWVVDRLATWDPDVLHVNNGLAPMLAVVLGLAELGWTTRPAVMTLHGPLESRSEVTTPWSLRDRLPGSPRRRRQAAIARFFACFDQIITVSRRNAEEATRRYGIDAKRFVYVPNGVDTEAFAPASRRTHPSTVVIGSAGRLVSAKRFDVLLQGVATIAPRRAIEVRIAGTGREADALADLARELGIEPIVHFVGFREDIADFLHELDVFAITSDLEGLPYVLLEAMACGLPSVATAVNEIPTVARDGQESILVPRGDVAACAAALARLVDEPELRHAMGRAARRRACDTYGIDTWRRRTLRLFETGFSSGGETDDA
jgi:glycosyltransferase involved in cell wall biosynthesis